MTYCGRCGEENPDKSVFCWKCGAKLVGESTEDIQEESTNEPMADEPIVSNEPSGSTETVIEPVIEDPELKTGWTRIDENTVAYGGKHFDICPYTRKQYRKYSIALIAIGYIVGLVMFFLYNFPYDGQATGYFTSFSKSLFGVATGDYVYSIAGADIVIILGIVFFILTFTAVGGIISAALGMLGMMMVRLIYTVRDTAFGTVNVPCETSVGAVDDIFVFMIVYMAIMVAAIWCMRKSTLHYNIRKDATLLGSLKALYMG